jgi:hypothetical protein
MNSEARAQLNFYFNTQPRFATAGMACAYLKQVKVFSRFQIQFQNQSRKEFVNWLSSAKVDNLKYLKRSTYSFISSSSTLIAMSIPIVIALCSSLLHSSIDIYTSRF